VSSGLAGLAHGLVEYRLQSDATLTPLSAVAALYYEFKWLLIVVVPATFVLLLFPDGHLLRAAGARSPGAPSRASEGCSC